VDETKPEQLAHKRRRKQRLGFMLTLTISAVSGCSNENALPHLTTYPVKGRVLLADGKPLSVGRVYFRRKAEPPIQAAGEIKPDGRFELGTLEPGDGAPEGEYTVRIDPTPNNLDGPAKRITLARIPSQYTDVDGGSLSATIAPGDNDLKPFTLK
jgi:hypothetical protein